MIKTLPIETFLQMDFSHVFDVRSPREFAESHIPNALNCAVLNNEEFEEIGTLYKQNHFLAKVLGASFITKNISQHLLNLKDLISPKKPFGIHCARGGMRSNAFAVVLDKIGYQVAILDGGYKSYRKYILDYLQIPPKHRFITLVGQTGSGKSEILQTFENALNLEEMANHCGSNFGGIYGEQPSVKMFQNLLFARLKSLENAPFVLVEGEGKKIGKLILPSQLYQAYQNAPKILIVAPLQQRTQRILQQYGKIAPEFFEISMQKIAPFMQKKFWKEAKDSFYRGNLSHTVEILLVQY